MNKHIDAIADQVRSADTLPALLVATFIGLEMLERATNLLSEIAPEEAYPAYATALTEANDAWWALSEAPSLSAEDGNAFLADSGYQELAGAVAALGEAISEALLNAVNKITDPADRVACLKAVQHVSRVHSALR